MANLRSTGLPTNLQALEQTKRILVGEIEELQKKVTLLDELRADLEAVQAAINVLQTRVRDSAAEAEPSDLMPMIERKW